MHLNCLLAPQSSKHFADNCLINPCALHRIITIKKKNLSRIKAFLKDHLLIRVNPREEAKQKISDVLRLSDPRCYQPRESDMTETCSLVNL